MVAVAVAGAGVCKVRLFLSRSENLCMYGVFMRENREIARSPVPLITG
jgi:hypothetical protein